MKLTDNHYQELIDQQTAFIAEYGFGIGERVRVDNLLDGIITKSLPIAGQVAIEFDYAAYKAAFPEHSAPYPVATIRQFCPIEKLAKPG